MLLLTAVRGGAVRNIRSLNVNPGPPNVISFSYSWHIKKEKNNKGIINNRLSFNKTNISIISNNGGSRKSLAERGNVLDGNACVGNRYCWSEYTVQSSDFKGTQLLHFPWLFLSSCFSSPSSFSSLLQQVSNHFKSF